MARAWRLGAFAVVGAGVELGEGCVLQEHAVVQGPSKFGAGNVFHPFCVIGGDPQDYTFGGEHVDLIVGIRNIFREYVTISRGTKKRAAGQREWGARIFFCGIFYVGHDCQIGDGTLMVNGATLAGHVTVQDFVDDPGAFSPVHQYCRLGRYAYIGASTVITQDVLPFSMIVTERETKCFGPNTIGLESEKDFRQNGLNCCSGRFDCCCARRKILRAGAGRDGKSVWRFYGCARVDGVHEDGGTGNRQVGAEDRAVGLNEKYFMPEDLQNTSGWGLIAGNGRFPFLVLEGRAARELRWR